MFQDGMDALVTLIAYATLASFVVIIVYAIVRVI